MIVFLDIIAHTLQWLSSLFSEMATFISWNIRWHGGNRTNFLFSMACSVGQDNKQSQQHLPRCIDVTIYALLTKSMSRWLDTGRVFFFPILWTENCLFREAGKRANCVCSTNPWESFMFPLFRLSSAAFCNSIADVCPFQICFCAGSKWAIPSGSGNQSEHRVRFLLTTGTAI